MAKDLISNPAAVLGDMIPPEKQQLFNQALQIKDLSNPYEQFQSLLSLSDEQKATLNKLKQMSEDPVSALKSGMNEEMLTKFQEIDNLKSDPLKAVGGFIPESMQKTYQMAMDLDKNPMDVVK